MSVLRFVSGAVIAAVMAAGVVARADDAPATPTATAAAVPWAQGVPTAQQDQATALFEAGNQLFAQQAHAPALEKYKAALALWDHPLIRFNLAVTLIRLDRMLDAADALDAALKFGAAPFTAELYQQALDYQALLKGRVGEIDATCPNPGAHVLLDGKLWFVAPGTEHVRVIAGEHTLGGELADYLTSSRHVVVIGGKTTTVRLDLIPVDAAVVLTYRYQRWLPWTITAGGVVVGLAGLATWLSGRNDMDAFDREYATMCPMGCTTAGTGPHPLSPLLADDSSRAELEGKIGIGLMVGGGAIAVAGAVMTILNRPQRHLPTVEIEPTAGGAISALGWRF